MIATAGNATTDYLSIYFVKINVILINIRALGTPITIDSSLIVPHISGSTCVEDILSLYYTALELLKYLPNPTLD